MYIFRNAFIPVPLTLWVPYSTNFYYFLFVNFPLSTVFNRFILFKNYPKLLVVTLPFILRWIQNLPLFPCNGFSFWYYISLLRTAHCFCYCLQILGLYWLWLKPRKDYAVPKTSKSKSLPEDQICQSVPEVLALIFL